MPRQSKAEKAAQKAVNSRVDAAYMASCEGIQVPMMKIPEIFNVGRAAIAAGADDTALRAAIRSYVDTIRCN